MIYILLHGRELSAYAMLEDCKGGGNILMSQHTDSGVEELCIIY